MHRALEPLRLCWLLNRDSSAAEGVVVSGLEAGECDGNGGSAGLIGSGGGRRRRRRRTPAPVAKVAMRGARVHNGKRRRPWR